MATIGDQLLQPEVGWKRYDDRDSRILFIGSNWIQSVDSGPYLNTLRYIERGLSSEVVKSHKIKMKFYGTKIRFIHSLHPEHTLNIKYKIDGVEIGNGNAYGGTTTRQVLLYEVAGLQLGVHEVEIYSGDGIRFDFDAIDIDLTGRLLHPTLEEVFVPKDKDLDIGKVIRCHYTATSNSVGTFSGLGEETSDLIPATSSATPNGDFYWVCVGYDFLGRKKLIADRNIQHSISWDTLNSVGAVGDLPITFTGLENMNFVTRLMSGGISSTDKDNEWDKIIVESDLGGVITEGDDSIWNWRGISSWTSTTPSTSTNRVVRGNSDIRTLTNLVSTTSNSTTGFRPVLLIEHLLGITNFHLSKTNVWEGDKGSINLTCFVEHVMDYSIQYKVLIGDREVIPLSEPQPTPAELDIQISVNEFEIGENLLALVVLDEAGEESWFKYIVIKENRDTFTFKRVFDFKEDYITDENIDVIYGKGLALKKMGAGKVKIEIPTEGKSKIKNIEVDGTEDIGVKKIFQNEMTYVQDLGEGRIYESRLLTEYTDIVDIGVI